MPLAFHAAVVRVRKEQWGLITLLSVDADLAAERYLTIQRKAAFSPDDERFGMNDVYIETCGQGWSWYGHVEAFQLAPNRIRVQLDLTAAREMNDTGAIDVTFDLAPELFAELRAALRQSFAGCVYYEESA